MKFIDLFAGIGGFRKGMEAAGHECVGFCEFDRFATASYTAMHLATPKQLEHLATLPMNRRQKEILNEEYRNGEWYAKDIREVSGDTIPKADIWCFGAPCFVSGALITTHRGLVPIEDICVGDFVLTHTNSFKPVTEKMINYKSGIYTIKVQGAPETKVTGNHRFYVRYKSRKYNSVKRNYDTVWSEPEWKAVEEFNGSEFIMFPHNNNSDNAMNLTDEECWLLGRYVADGYLQEYKRNDRDTFTRRVAFCIGAAKESEFINNTEAYLFSIDRSAKSCLKYTSTDKRLFGLCAECGRGAENKRIPMFVMNLPADKLKIFVEGYLSGDGSEKNCYFKAQSVSKTLIYQLGQCVFKAYGTPFSICHSEMKPTHVIEGRVVNQKNYFCLQFHKELRKQNNGRVVDGNLWMPLKEVVYHGREKEIVYNLEVEDDHSYTANGLAAHNCQDFSVAGKMRGLEGDRSSLVREVFRIVGEIREADRPEWLIYENVKGMLSSNRGFDFLAILLEMDELGYDCEWFLFNSKYHGVPQNRERVYLAGHLRSRGSAKIFPVKGTDGADNLSINILGHHKSYRRNTQIFDPDGVTETLSTCQGGGREHYTIVKLPPDDLDTNHLYNQRGTVHSPNGIARTINASHSGNEPKVVIPVLTPERAEKRQNGRRFKENGEESFTLTAQDRHGVAISIEPEVIGGIGEKNFGKQFRQGNRVYDGMKVGCALNSQPVGNAGGQSYLYSLPVDMSGNHASEGDDIARCLNANDQRKVFGANQTRTMAGVLVDGGVDEENGLYVELAEDVVVYAIWYPKYECYIAIRRLTPRECFRLQGWDDDYFERAALVSSDSQLYKQAGNGVTTTVAEVVANAIKEATVCIQK